MELTALRNYNSKTFTNPDGTFTAEVHAGHIHYKDSQGNLQDVDFTLEDMGTYWRMAKANYKLYIAKDFVASQLIRFDNKFNGADHTIYFEPHSIQWVNKTNPADRVLIKAAQSVTGVMDNDSHTITYSNAFGPDIDYVIELRRAGFKKYVRFNVKPTLTPPSADYVPVLLHKYEGSGLKLRANDSGVDWDGDSYYESEEGFSLTEATSQYFSRIREAYIWDATGTEQKLKLYWEKRDAVLWMAKVLLKAFLADAVYPVMADAPIYADAAGDGYVNRVDEATWAAARETAAGENAGTNQTNQPVGANWEAGPLFHCWRTYFPFNTSVIPAAAVISAATFDVYVTAKADADGGQIGLVQTKQAAVNTLAVGDFDECGESAINGWSSTTDVDIIEGATRKDITTDITTTAYNTWTLNATGLTWVARSGETLPAGGPSAGYTLLGLREAIFDLDNAAPSSGANRISIDFSDKAGTTTDPKLTVTYTVPGIPILRRRRECA